MLDYQVSKEVMYSPALATKADHSAQQFHSVSPEQLLLLQAYVDEEQQSSNTQNKKQQYANTPMLANKDHETRLLLCCTRMGYRSA